MDHSEIFADKLERYIAQCVPILDQFKFQGKIVDFREWFKNKVEENDLVLNHHHFYTVADYLGIDTSDSLFIDLEDQIFSDATNFQLSPKVVQIILKAVDLQILVLRHQNPATSDSTVEHQIGLLHDIEYLLGKPTEMVIEQTPPPKKKMFSRIFRRTKR